ncbi:hypothetical protein TWF679_010226 [Orbilia oligospora]|uniref:Uncharacterized protein n=1 Tax=Orbilia oligospora TaxID=2813651 RepID=A0A8H8V0U9_ORBOL|nr:hypothetical protein TWF679_010226 [Orbilia oligospora]
MADEDAFTQKLVQFNSNTFARLQQQEYDWSAAFEASESESEPDYLDPDYSGSEDDEIYQLAIKRARKNVVPETGENPNKGISTVVIERDQTLHYHPNSTILKAMGLADEVFSPDSPSFAKVNLSSHTSGQSLGFSRIVWASSIQKHVVVDWNPQIQRVRDLPMLLYLVWRFETYPGIQGGQYHAIQVPGEPTGPLEYITINNITDAKSLTILTRAAELPGRRLQNYHDPIQKKNRYGYVFDSKVLSQYHKDSPERKAINALLGSEPIMAIRKMLHAFRRGLSEAEISSIFLWIDYNEDNSSAMILLQLSHKASGLGDPPGSFALDKQPPGVDPHLIITSRGTNPVYHPLSPPSYEIEPSYFEASAQYRMGSGRSFDFYFYYSTVEGHFVLGGLGQLGETLDDSDAAKAGSILYSAWIREAGLKPILSVTFIDLSNAASSLAASIHGVQGSWILLDIRNNPEDFAILAQKLAETQCRERKLVQALLGMSGENFGQFQLVQLNVGINEENKASLMLTVEYNQYFQSDSQGLFGDTDNALLVALRRGTRMKAEMEVLEPRFLDEEAAMQQEVNNLPSGRVKQSEYREGDKTISFSKAIIGQYNFVPNKPLDCISERKPPLLRDIISWNKELENPAHPEHRAYDDVQSQWRRKLAAAFNEKELFCTFTLSQKYPEHNPQDNQNQGNFEFGISHGPGYVFLRSKFGSNIDGPSFGGAIWALWVTVDTATELHPNLYLQNVANGRTGLRYVVILQPSDETINILRTIYLDLGLSRESIIIFPSKDTAFNLPPDISTIEDNVRRRVLLTIYGLREVHAIDELFSRTFQEPYSILNYRRRVNAVLVKWYDETPQLVIMLGHFTFDNPRLFSGRSVSNFKLLSPMRQRKDLMEFTTAGCEIAWSSISSYMFDVSDYSPQTNLIDNGSAAPENKPLEYTFANTGSMLGCPQDIQGFIQIIPWREYESNIRRRITAQEVADLRQLATEEITEEDKQAYLKGEMGPKLYKSFEYTRQYHPARCVFTVRAGPPYHLMVAVANDGQAGLSAEAGLPRSTRIERLSRAYYDFFVRTMDLVRSPGSETRWISMRAHELSFETSSTIRNLYNMASRLVPNWQGFDISFTAGPSPTLQDNEEIQVGKTLLGLVEIGALGRMLSDYSRVMQNLKIARIIIRTAPNSEGVPDSSFQVLIMLRPLVFLGRPQ